MSQSVVFINMVASFIFLHFRYNVYHIGGVILVMIGITIDIFPLFANSSGGDDPNAWLWILLLFVSNIPAAASNGKLYFEIISHQIDIIFSHGRSPNTTSLIFFFTVCEHE